jgi:hypothetical protein
VTQRNEEGRSKAGRITMEAAKLKELPERAKIFQEEDAMCNNDV